METQTTFELNLAIRRWREDLARSSAFRSENLNELESHLRDSIDRLRAPQLSDEEVFFIATRRIGNAPRLEQEFGKINNAAVWFDRCLWVLVAVQLWTFMSSLSTLFLASASLISTSLNEILPGIGLHKIGTDGMLIGLALAFSMLMMAIVALLAWRYFIWPKRRGSALLQKLLRQPGYLALSLFLACVISLIVAGWVLQTWYYPAAFHGVQWQHFLLRLPSLALWAVLTFFVARKRLCSIVA